MDAPRGSVELREAEELERLRRRAYGRDADIAGDAAAQARLSELEAAHRQQGSVRDPTARDPAAVPERVLAREPVEGPRSTSTSIPQPVEGASAEHRPAAESVTDRVLTEGPIADPDPLSRVFVAPSWRRHRWLAILGVVTTALALIAIGAGLPQLIADGSTPIPTETSTAEMPHFPAAQGRPYYVPRPDYILPLKSVGEDADQPNDPNGTLDALGISRDEVRRYADFQGPFPGTFNVWSGQSRFGMTCLFLAPFPGETRYGFSGEGCSLPGKDTIMDVQIGSGGHERFVLRDDHVNVYVYEGDVDPNASRD